MKYLQRSLVPVGARPTVLGLAAWSTALALAAAPLKLHVPSPDWRDQIIYFVMTDRFADGDPGNNDQGAGEYRPGSPAHYHGGDLKGLREKLDYVRGLGATAVWVTPPVLSQWWDGHYAGFHGYWAQDFSRMDPHVGSLADYRALSDALHRRGMYLVQDIVVNHTGNYFYMRPTPQGLQWEPHPGSRPTTAPTQAPFHLNDARQPSQRAAGIYHWTTDVSDFQDPQQLLNFQMSGLDDLNTENPVVRRALRQSYAHWIKAVGVDAYRIDTAFYVPPAYFSDLLYAKDKRAPGLMDVARQTGRRDFFLFGEGFAIDKPFQTREAQRIEAYMRGPRGEALLPGMLNFPLYGSGTEVFSRGAPTAVLGHRITEMVRQHPRLHWMPSFVDNHDVDRALSSSTVRGLEQHLLALMTLPGIPVIYYGTEQGFTEPRPSMFAAARADRQDQYNAAHPLYQRLAQLTALRREHAVLRRGTPVVLAEQASGPGGLVFEMRDGLARALVAFNTSDQPVLVSSVATSLPQGAPWRGVLGLDGRPASLRTGTQGQIHLVLPPHSGQVWLGEATQGRPRVTDEVPTTLPTWGQEALATGDVRQATGDFTLRGEGATGPGSWQWVVDGGLGSAQPLEVDALGRWQVRVDTRTMVDPDLQHQGVLWNAQQQRASPPLRFRVTPQWQTVLQQDDPAGDDHGPQGRYVYPTDPSWGDNRQQDIRALRAEVSGGALRLQIRMNTLTQFWSPPQGFDHLALTVFIELPDEPGGARVMPLQNADLPDGMRWHRRLRIHGWTNTLFSHEGASPTHEGTPMTPAARLKVNPSTQTVELTLPASALGGRSGLGGARIYLNSWDWDGAYRSLTPAPLSHGFGGGAPGDPLFMDDLGPVTLKP